MNYGKDQESINLYSIINSIKQNKELTISVFLIIFFSSILYAFLNKPKWEGEFQIVLEFDDLDITSNIREKLSNFGLSDQNNSLKTQVSILKSPSVLRPTFNFVKEKKKEQGIDILRFYYRDWQMNSLKVDLEKGTSVLKITYIDQDKDLILPVLTKISNAYQIYSGSKRRRELDNAVSFIQNEIKRLDKNSQSAMKELQSFSFKNNLGNPDGIPVESLIGVSGVIDQENSAFKKDNSADLIRAGSTKDSIAFANLAKLENELISRSQFYKENSREIKSLKSKIGHLKEAIKRPSEVLLKYRKLKNEALKKEAFLFQMQSQLARLEIEKARQKDPWQLISTPTLRDDSISPTKKRIIALGIIAGAIGSIFAANLKKSLALIIKEQLDKN